MQQEDRKPTPQILFAIPNLALHQIQISADGAGLQALQIAVTKNQKPRKSNPAEFPKAKR
jgi:hypothetical protein